MRSCPRYQKILNLFYISRWLYPTHVQTFISQRLRPYVKTVFRARRIIYGRMYPHLSDGDGYEPSRFTSRLLYYRHKILGSALSFCILPTSLTDASWLNASACVFNWPVRVSSDYSPRAVDAVGAVPIYPHVERNIRLGITVATRTVKFPSTHWSTGHRWKGCLSTVGWNDLHLPKSLPPWPRSTLPQAGATKQSWRHTYRATQCSRRGQREKPNRYCSDAFLSYLHHSQGWRSSRIRQLYFRMIHP